MKTINIKDIKVKPIDCHSGNLLQFEYEGGEAYYSAADAGFIDSGEALARTTMFGESEFERGLTCDIFVRSDDKWGEHLFHEAANRRLEGLGVKLGKWHDFGQWYELEAL